METATEGGRRVVQTACGRTVKAPKEFRSFGDLGLSIWGSDVDCLACIEARLAAREGLS